MPEATGADTNAPPTRVETSYEALAAAVAGADVAAPAGGHVGFREILIHLAWTILLVLGASFWWYAAH